MVKSHLGHRRTKCSTPRPQPLLLPVHLILVHHRVSNMKQPGVLLLSLDGMLVHHRVSSMKQIGVSVLPPNQNGMLDHHRVLKSNWECYYSPLDGMLLYHKVPSMTQLEALLLPPGWDAIPSQGTHHETTRSIQYYSTWMGC